MLFWEPTIFCTLLKRSNLKHFTRYRQTFLLLPQMLLVFLSNSSIFGSSSTNIYQALTRCQISRICVASCTTFLRILKRWRIMVGRWRSSRNKKYSTPPESTRHRPSSALSPPLLPGRRPPTLAAPCAAITSATAACAIPIAASPSQTRRRRRARR